MKTKTDISAKPYNKCLHCRHRHVNCNGPRTASMSLREWCEYMRTMKEANGLTNADVSEKTGISIKTIEKLLALTYEQDIMRETARRIEEAIVGSANLFPCYLAIEENMSEDSLTLKTSHQLLEDARAREKQLLNEIDRLYKDIEYYRTENDRKARIIDKLLEK